MIEYRRKMKSIRNGKVSVPPRPMEAYMSKLPNHYDTIIIGAGVTGCAAAWALSQYQLNVLVIEAQDDIACGASKANSGIVHAGYDCEPGTLKAKFNVEGSSLFPAVAKDLDIPYKMNGSLVLCFHEAQYPLLEALYQRGLTNGVPGLKLLTAAQAYQLEPNLAPGLHSALLAQSAGIVSPYEATIAFAENAAQNRVEFLLEAPVTKIIHTHGRPFIVETPKGSFSADTVINAAGVDSDTIHNQVAGYTETILPQRGQYYLLDNAYQGFVNHTLFPLPGPKGKGVLIAPTVDGNTLIGPNNEDLSKELDFNDRHDTQTTRMGLAEILEKGTQSVVNLPIYGSITTFAGIRAKHEAHDFVINEPVPGFINALGIDSPGLSAAPAIGKELAKMVADKLHAVPNPDYNPKRVGIKRFNLLPFEEQAALIQENPRYGHVVCRCETITEAEIIDAIHRPVGARSLAGLKRRTRAQMGRCQGGFCSLKLAEILAKELNISEESIWTC